MSLFDAYIFVDWSAANTVKPERQSPDSVWVGEFVAELGLMKESYHRTRYSGFKYVEQFLQAQVAKKRRVLVGFDFPYGYPTGFAKHLSDSHNFVGWKLIWSELSKRIKDSPENRSNRFLVGSEFNSILGGERGGPFWGCPVGKENENLKCKSPRFPFVSKAGVEIERLRIVESRLPRTQETWKLFGNGSVGSQALVGIPYILKLRQHPDLEKFSHVWPFETGFSNQLFADMGPLVIHAEIWPGVVEERVRLLSDCDPKLIRDCAQVRAMCQWAYEYDKAGLLDSHFNIPSGLSEQQIKLCVEEEGWVLGAK